MKQTEFGWRYRAIRAAKLRRNPKRKKPADCEVCGWMATVHVGLVYDHNHRTGDHRGWLCNGCNSALGFAGDNPAILRALADYLDREGYDPTRPLHSVPSPPGHPVELVSDNNAPQHTCQVPTP